MESINEMHSDGVMKFHCVSDDEGFEKVEECFLSDNLTSTLRSEAQKSF